MMERDESSRKRTLRPIEDHEPSSFIIDHFLRGRAPAQFPLSARRQQAELRLSTADAARGLEPPSKRRRSMPIAAGAVPPQDAAQNPTLDAASAMLNALDQVAVPRQGRRAERGRLAPGRPRVAGAASVARAVPVDHPAR